MTPMVVSCIITAATAYSQIITINSADVTVSGFTIEAEVINSGILLTSSDNVVISDNVFSQNIIGLRVNNCNNVLISNNVFINGGQFGGVSFGVGTTSDNVTITGNEFISYYFVLYLSVNII